MRPLCLDSLEQISMSKNSMKLSMRLSSLYCGPYTSDVPVTVDLSFIFRPVPDSVQEFDGRGT